MRQRGRRAAGAAARRGPLARRDVSAPAAHPQAPPRRILWAFKLNPFEKLNLRFDCTLDDVKKAFRKISLMVHPDKCKHEHASTAFESARPPPAGCAGCLAAAPAAGRSAAQPGPGAPAAGPPPLQPRATAGGLPGLQRAPPPAWRAAHARPPPTAHCRPLPLPRTPPQSWATRRRRSWTRSSGGR